MTALVMELVEGEDLSQRIARGAIPLDEALPIARQIAEALEAAHEQGIVHRDLKPANIKLRPDGVVKVLDFGLAKAMDPSGVLAVRNSMSPTITTPAMTQAGMILGTAAYMSPEQARGKTADKRADIWAFGAVLFDDADVPALIDLVPAWRPKEWSAAVIVVDAVAWGGADEALIDRWSHLEDWSQMLLRAVLHRLALHAQHPDASTRTLAGLERAADLVGARL